MIAIPVKTDKENGILSPLFGKAKYFAFIQNGKVEIKKNEHSGGRAVVRWLKDQGINKLITSHMGKTPFEFLQNLGIKVYFAGEERIELTDLLLKYSDGDLIELTNSNFDIFIQEDDHHHGTEPHHHHSHNESCEHKSHEPCCVTQGRERGMGAGSGQGMGLGRSSGQGRGLGKENGQGRGMGQNKGNFRTQA
ncbi:MAG: NifB/NifX family molybdenum-iron cluster-binding protein [Arcobacteraceae bacterium]|jgi:predicted Fe-Mo cluster-binding NifX family protein|nr:NifB/NifX family molybdenum-iron cluster-binding protein [Arcobacteraceae bacterium]